MLKVLSDRRVLACITIGRGISLISSKCMVFQSLPSRPSPLSPSSKPPNQYVEPLGHVRTKRLLFCTKPTSGKHLSITSRNVCFHRYFSAVVR